MVVVVVGARKKEKKKKKKEKEKRNLRSSGQWSVVRVTVQSSEPNVDP